MLFFSDSLLLLIACIKFDVYLSILSVSKGHQLLFFRLRLVLWVKIIGSGFNFGYQIVHTCVCAGREREKKIWRTFSLSTQVYIISIPFENDDNELGLYPFNSTFL